MTQCAFGPTWEMPTLNILPTLYCCIFHFKFNITTFFAQKYRIGLIFIPNIGIAPPNLSSIPVVIAVHLFMMHDSCFKTSQAIGISFFCFHGKGLHGDRAVREPLTGGSGRRCLRIKYIIEIDRPFARNRKVSEFLSVI